jgi:hypothetical protein
MKTITFDDNVKLDILMAFNKIMDRDGFIIDKETKEKELDYHGSPIKLDEFAGILNYKGKPTFFKSDLPSLIELVDLIREP